MTSNTFEFPGTKVPTIDVHFHHFPHFLRDMGEFAIAAPQETDNAMSLLVGFALVV